MSKAEEIISEHIRELEARMDWELDSQITAEMEDDTDFDMDTSDLHWHELFSMKVELMRVMAEIQEVDCITDVVLK